jgi:hypothetical protein
VPRRPTWDDVPRYKDGRFAPRSRVQDLATSVSIGSVRVIKFCIISVVVVSGNMASAVASSLSFIRKRWLLRVVVVLAVLSAFLLGYFFFRHSFGYYLGV